MIAIHAGLLLALALPGFAGRESATAPTPDLTVVSVSADQSATLAALMPPTGLRPSLAEPAAVPITPVKPVKRVEVPKVTPAMKHTWIALTVFQHSAATLDAWSTRRSVTSGNGHELNPLMKPFAGSGAMYAAVQLAPLGTDYLAQRWMHSTHPTLRKLWWLPQAASTVGFTWSTAHNMSVASGH